MPVPFAKQAHPSFDLEEEEEESAGHGEVFNFEMPDHQRHIRTRNFKNATVSPKKSVSFERHAIQYEQVYDAEGDMRSRGDGMGNTDHDDAAAAQLQEETQRNARRSRDQSLRQQIHSAGPSQSMGSNGRSPSRQDSAVGLRTTRSRSPPKRNVTTASSSRVVSNKPQTATSSASPTFRRAQTPFISTDPTPAANLTPQEKKDNELDANVMARLANIRSLIKKLCDDHLAFDMIRRRPFRWWKKWLENLEADEATKFLNFSRAVAEGGGSNEAWLELVLNAQHRFALGYGIVHRALVRHVFGELLFGAPKDLLASLEEMQVRQEDEDGFYRQEKRAEYITSYELLHRVDLSTTPEHKQATLKLAMQIAELLRPLLKLRGFDQDEYDQMTQSLILIVSAAADLATLMRKNGNTVLYQFANAFKCQVVDLSQMDILNLEELNKEQKVGGTPGAYEALTRILCAQPFYAYRRGGGVMAERILEREEKQVDYSVAPELRHLRRNEYQGRLIMARDGYRHKFLAKAVFVATWGQAGERLVGLDEAVQTLEDDGCAQQ